jgi:hypothetical protein
VQGKVCRELGELDVGAPPNRTNPVSDETTCPMIRADYEPELALFVIIDDINPGRSDSKPAPVPRRTSGR